MENVGSKTEYAQANSSDFEEIFSKTKKTNVLSNIDTTGTETGGTYFIPTEGKSRISRDKSDVWDGETTDGWDGDDEEFYYRFDKKQYMIEDANKKVMTSKLQFVTKCTSTFTLQEKVSDYLSIENISAPDFLIGLECSSSTAQDNYCCTQVSEGNAPEEPNNIGDSFKYEKYIPESFPRIDLINNRDVERKLIEQDEILNELEMYFIKSLDVLRFDDDVPLNYDADSCDDTTDIARRFKDLMHIQEACIQNVSKSQNHVKSNVNSKNPIMLKIKNLQAAINTTSNLYGAFRSYQRRAFSLKFHFNTFDLEELQSVDRMKNFESRMYHLNKSLDGILHDLKSSTIKCKMISNHLYAECDHYSNLIQNEINDSNDKAMRWQECLKEMECRYESLRNENMSFKTQISDLEASAETKDLEFSAKENAWKKQLDDVTTLNNSITLENQEISQTSDQLKIRNEEIMGLLITNQEEDISRFHWKSLRTQLNEVNKKNVDISHNIQELKKSNDLLKSEKFGLMSDKDVLNRQIEELQKLKTANCIDENKICIPKKKRTDKNANKIEKQINKYNYGYIASKSKSLTNINDEISANSVIGQRDDLIKPTTEILNGVVENSQHNLENAVTNSSSFNLNIYEENISKTANTRGNCQENAAEVASEESIQNPSCEGNRLSTIFESEEDNEAVCVSFNKQSETTENCDGIIEESGVTRSIACNTSEDWRKEDEEIEAHQKDSSENLLCKINSATSRINSANDFINEYQINHTIYEKASSASLECENNLNTQSSTEPLSLVMDEMTGLRFEIAPKSTENLLFKCKHVNCKSLFYKMQEAERKLEEQNKSITKLKSIIVNFKRKYQRESQSHANLQARYEKVLQEKIKLDYHIKNKCEQGEIIEFDGLTELSNYKDEIIEKLMLEKSAVENKLKQITYNIDGINNSMSEKNLILRVSNENITKLQADNVKLKTKLITLERKLSHLKASLIISEKEQEQLRMYYNEMTWYAKNHELYGLEYEESNNANDCNIADNLTKLSNDNNMLCKHLQNVLNKVRNFEDSIVYSAPVKDKIESNITKYIGNNNMDPSEILVKENIQNNYITHIEDLNVSNPILISSELLEATKSNGSGIQLCKERINSVLFCFVILNMKYIKLNAKYDDVVNKMKFLETRHKTLTKNVSTEIVCCKNEIKEEIMNLAKEIKGKNSGASLISSRNSLKIFKPKLDNLRERAKESQQELNRLYESNMNLEETKRKLILETERLQVESRASMKEATEARRLLYEREQESKLLQDEITDLQGAVLLNKQSLKRITECELADLRVELESTVRTKIELEGKLALLDNLYKALMDNYTSLKMECDEKAMLESELLQEIAQLRNDNEELRRSRRPNGCTKDCTNERCSLEDRLRKFTDEAEGARNLVVEIKRMSREELAQEKQEHAEQLRKLNLENEAVCQCNKTLRAQIGRLEADNMLLAKNIDNRSKKSKSRDPKCQGFKTNTDDIHKGKMLKRTA